MDELRRLKYFVACGEELHFTRAAARLGIAQPPLSQQIKLLESEIGARLFDRTTRGVELTSAGASLLQEARAVIASAERAVINAQRIGRGEAGEIRVGFTGSIALNPIVPAVIASFRAAYPLVGVKLQEDTTTSSLRSLRDGRLDIALIRPSQVETEALFSQKLLDEQMLVAVPASHDLAQRTSVKISELSLEPFVLYPRTNGQALYDLVVATCQANGFSPNIVQEAPQMVSTVSLVAAGIGVAMVTETMRQLHNKGVVYLPIEGTEAPVASINMVRRERPVSTTILNFQKVVREILKKGPDGKNTSSADSVPFIYSASVIS
ncbi:LysR family transcriptional regulator [Mesorhizobium kowhaii]|uniref:LysR family transcriptional regulator n=1 Tax=Mesorhizobium kowhaii TaxID=1300272 RepID=UPI0035E64BDF